MAGERILAIDDEIFYRTFYEDLLSQEEYIVQLAENGGTALKLWGRERFDLLIVDHPLEGVNGIQLLEMVREKDPFLPVLFVGPEDLPQALIAFKKGATDYINKPLHPEAFKSLIRSTLDRSQALREKAAASSEGLGQLRILEIIRKTKDLLLTKSREEAFQSLLNLALEETTASRGGFLWREKDSPNFRLRAQKGLFPSQASPPTIASGKGVIGAILSKASPTILGQIIEEEPGARFLGRMSTLILPMERRRQVVGGLILGDKASGEPFTQMDIHSLTPLAVLVPLFLEGGEGRDVGMEGRRISLEELPNQATFEALVEKEVKKAQRYRRGFSLILINIDQLHSHLGGARGLSPEEILQHLHESLLSTIRGADMAGLLDNGEVGLLVPETNYQGAIAAARRIRHAVRDLPIVRERPLPSPSPILFGIACFPEHGLTKDELLERAHQAMARSAESAARFESLWGYIDKLLSGARISSELISALSGSREKREEASASIPVDSDQPLPTEEYSKELQFVPSWDDFASFNQYIEDKILERLAGEGILYVGLKRLAQLQSKLERYRRMLENGIKVFVFAQEDWEGWDPQEITAVVTEDPALAQYSLLLYYGVSACYALVGRERKEERMSGFFTTSDFLVNEIMKKLNETYL